MKVRLEKPEGLRTNTNSQIFFNADKLNHDTPLHEVFHDATNKAIRENPQLAKLMDRLREEMQTAYDNDTSRIPIETAIKIETNAFKNSKEFLTYMMTNEKVQDYFKGFKISDELSNVSDRYPTLAQGDTVEWLS